MLIKTFDNGNIIEIGKGAFDGWCVYLTNSKGKHAPRDKDYFRVLKGFGTVFGRDIVYKDFLDIYNRVNNEISTDTLVFITDLSKNYGEYSTKFDIIFTILYLGMVAEENKANTKLGKRIKRLGVHQVLIEKVDYEIAANFSRGLRASEIDSLCKIRGF